MIIADFECTTCGSMHEDMVDASVWESTCPDCHAKTKRIITLGGVNCMNEYAQHIRESTAILLDMETARCSKDPIERALAENPCRSNLNAYLKHKNLRYVENERGAPPMFRRRPDPDMRQVHREVAEAYRKRQRLKINT